MSSKLRHIVHLNVKAGDMLNFCGNLLLRGKTLLLVSFINMDNEEREGENGERRGGIVNINYQKGDRGGIHAIHIYSILLSCYIYVLIGCPLKLLRLPLSNRKRRKKR